MVIKQVNIFMFLHVIWGYILQFFMMAKADASGSAPGHVHPFVNGAVCGPIFYVGSQK